MSLLLQIWFKRGTVSAMRAGVKNGRRVGACLLTIEIALTTGSMSKPRRRFQIRLSTVIVMALCAGALLPIMIETCQMWSDAAACISMRNPFTSSS